MQKNPFATLNMFDWHTFLAQWSRDLIDTENNRSRLPVEVIESGWLGFPGATDAQISEAESRLNVSLPPSYKEFLKVSNGWRQTTPFIYKIWSIQEVNWFNQRHSDWIQIFTYSYLNFRHSENSLQHYQLNGTTHSSLIPDSEYLQYDENQDCSKIRLHYLNAALEISEKGESAIYLLNPQVVSEDGEWEAWFFGDWLPGADRYPSFQAMMEAEYRNFLEMGDS